jgi:CxxC motif-containing protein (DUF1111 family)
MLAGRTSIRPAFLALFCVLALGGSAYSQSDPGPRGGTVGAGGALAGLNTYEVDFFNAAQGRFEEVNSVSGSIDGEESKGLGPTFNGNSCAQCHAEPSVGGTSPHPTLGFVKAPNPQVDLAALDRVPGRSQTVPSFILPDGPIREARFIRNPDGTSDGAVHGLYTIAGRTDAPAKCTLAQPDFALATANHNIVFRIPTPLFGLGLIENVSDDALISSLNSTVTQRSLLGIGGRFNRNSNDGTITRFGWKAQDKSLLIFAGEAYNVEMGVTNELFPNKRSVANCAANAIPEDSTNIRNQSGGGPIGTASQMISDTVNFAAFIRLLAPPKATTSTKTEKDGEALFKSIGCTLCHTQTLVTGESVFTGQNRVSFQPYTDVALHHMGSGLADFISQGGAGPDEFRTAPLWGVGQRIFFLHDGRARPDTGGLLKAVLSHKSTNPACTAGQTSTPDGVTCRSEANAVIDVFELLPADQQQDILNFLRSL